MLKGSNEELILPRGIAPVTGGVSRELVDLYTRAFIDEPLFHYVFPDPVARARCVPILAEKIQRLRLLQGARAFIAADQSKENGAGRLSGFSFWFEPGRDPAAGLFQQLRVGLMTLPFQMGFGPLYRLVTFGAHADSIVKRALVKPHWLLDIIAVHPDFQRRGIGRDLMDFVFAAAARANTPCYVLTHNERNVRFYEKYGFRVDVEERGAPDMPMAWGLRRVSER